jgi:hypothetical protein
LALFAIYFILFITYLLLFNDFLGFDFFNSFSTQFPSMISKSSILHSQKILSQKDSRSIDLILYDARKRSCSQISKKLKLNSFNCTRSGGFGVFVSKTYCSQGILGVKIVIKSIPFIMLQATQEQLNL